MTHINKSTWPSPWKLSVWQTPVKERTNQNAIFLHLDSVVPFKNTEHFPVFCHSKQFFLLFFYLPIKLINKSDFMFQVLPLVIFRIMRSRSRGKYLMTRSILESFLYFTSPSLKKKSGVSRKPKLKRLHYFPFSQEQNTWLG